MSSPHKKSSYRYVVTGANGGLGLESVRQLASLHCGASDEHSNPISTTIYLLCRNESSANDAIVSLSKEHSPQKDDAVTFTFVPFDSSVRSTVKTAVETLSGQGIVPDGEIIDGLLLNAGGFTHDKKGTVCESGATIIAETNLIGHAALLDGLIQSNKLAKCSRVVFSGSEAGLGEPFAIKWSNDLDYYVNIINGKAYGKNYTPADAYGHIKGMVAFYCSAVARHNTGIYFATVSPGSTRGTSLMDRGSFPKALNYVIKGYIKLSGQHGVDVGAKRYIDALVNYQEGWDYTSGTFVLSKKGYIGEICHVTELRKGKVFAEEAKQDLVYKAVQQFL